MRCAVHAIAEALVQDLVVAGGHVVLSGQRFCDIAAGSRPAAFAPQCHPARARHAVIPDGVQREPIREPCTRIPPLSARDRSRVSACGLARGDILRCRRMTHRAGFTAGDFGGTFDRNCDLEREGEAVVLALQRREDRHHVVGAVGGDAQVPARERARAGEQRLRLVLGGKQPRGDRMQRLADRGQLHAAALAREQADAIGRLQRLHLRGQRRLAQPRRCVPRAKNFRRWATTWKARSWVRFI